MAQRLFRSGSCKDGRGDDRENPTPAFSRRLADQAGRPRIGRVAQVRSAGEPLRLCVWRLDQTEAPHDRFRRLPKNQTATAATEFKAKPLSGPITEAPTIAAVDTIGGLPGNWALRSPFIAAVAPRARHPAAARHLIGLLTAAAAIGLRAGPDFCPGDEKRNSLKHL